MDKVETASLAYIRQKIEKNKREKDIWQRKENERMQKERLEIEKQKEFLFFSIVQKFDGNIVSWYYEPINDAEYSEYKGAQLEILNENNSYLETFIPIVCRLRFKSSSKVPQCNYRIYPPRAGVISFQSSVVRPNSLMARVLESESARIQYENKCRQREEEFLAYKSELEREECERNRKKKETTVYSREELLLSKWDSQKRSRFIPQSVVGAVYHRDGCRCVMCGSTENLQLDHIIPFSEGGANTVENLQVLCQRCNLKKSNKI